MAITEEFKQAFFNGQNCWRNNDYINARYWLEIAFKHEEFREESLSKLIQIEIKEGKYAKAKIETMNSNHFEVDEITSNLCVVTMIGTKDIVTRYPVKLSFEFDNEGFAYDKTIALKRTQGGINHD